MLTERWQKLTVTALAVYVMLLWSYALLGFPSEAQVCDYAKNDAQPYCTTHNFIVAIVRTTLLWVEHFHDSLLVLGTFLLAGVVVIQIRDARKSAERQLRAYIAIENAAVFRISNQPIQSVIKFRNSGQTPAYGFRGWTKIEIRPANDRPFDEQGEGISASILNPTGGAFVTIEYPMTLEQEEAVIQKKSKIFVWGRFDYIDIFKRPRHLLFRLAASGALIAIKIEHFEGEGWALIPDRFGYETEDD